MQILKKTDIRLLCNCSSANIVVIPSLSRYLGSGFSPSQNKPSSRPPLQDWYSHFCCSAQRLFSDPTCHTQWVVQSRISHVNLPHEAGNRATFNLEQYFNKSYFAQQNAGPLHHAARDCFLS